MITKAYVVEQSTKNKNEYRVRIPVFHNGNQHSTPDNELPFAILNTLPASDNVLHVGDCVFVGFDTNDLNKPVILGHLFTEEFNNKPIDLTLRKLDFTDDVSDNLCEAHLPKNTSIGNVTKTNIRCLEGLTDNVNQMFQNERFVITGGDSSAYSPSKFRQGTWSCLGKITTADDNSVFLWGRTD